MESNNNKTYVLVLEDRKNVKKENEVGKFSVVSEIDEKGRIKSVEPTEDNKKSFMKFNAKDTMLENFFKNLKEQFKDPSHIDIYKVLADKVIKNIESLKAMLSDKENNKAELCQLNYLVGSKDLKKSITKIFDANPQTFSVLDILIAVRTKSKKKVLTKKLNTVLVESYFENPESIYEFIVETGLAKVFKNENVTNLVDYVFGVEVGLDTNARKNRGGTQMETAIANMFRNAGLDFSEQIQNTDFKELTALGKDIKRFDYIVTKGKKKYLIEANFYNGGGSKLNEVCRAYTDIAPKINQYDHFEFVWITDGQGWFSAKNKLEEAFNNIPRVYNLTSLNEFIEEMKND